MLLEFYQYQQWLSDNQFGNKKSSPLNDFRQGLREICKWICILIFSHRTCRSSTRYLNQNCMITLLKNSSSATVGILQRYSIYPWLHHSIQNERLLGSNVITKLNGYLRPVLRKKNKDRWHFYRCSNVLWLEHIGADSINQASLN